LWGAVIRSEEPDKHGVSGKLSGQVVAVNGPWWTISD